MQETKDEKKANAALKRKETSLKKSEEERTAMLKLNVVQQAACFSTQSIIRKEISNSELNVVQQAASRLNQSSERKSEIMNRNCSLLN
jgi:hypothetical protein